MGDGSKRATATAKATRKPKIDHGTELLKAVGRYVESIGGAVVVAGGIQIQYWPGDADYQFVVAIKCTGRKPLKGAQAEQ